MISWNPQTRELTGAGIAAAFVEFQLPAADNTYLDSCTDAASPGAI